MTGARNARYENWINIYGKDAFASNLIKSARTSLVLIDDYIYKDMLL